MKEIREENGKDLVAEIASGWKYLYGKEELEEDGKSLNFGKPFFVSLIYIAPNKIMTIVGPVSECARLKMSAVSILPFILLMKRRWRVVIRGNFAKRGTMIKLDSPAIHQMKNVEHACTSIKNKSVSANVSQMSK